jgi:hypothetical protein
MSTRTYFRVDAESPVMRVVEDAESRGAAFADHCRSFEREYPGVKVWTWDNARMSGLEFPEGGALPDGWRFSVKRGYAVPDQRTKDGRALKKRMDSVVGVDAMTFSQMLSRALSAQFECHVPGRIMWTVYERHGDAVVLSVPLACNPELPGCTELKMSEYWKLREDGEQERNAA